MNVLILAFHVGGLICPLFLLISSLIWWLVLWLVLGLICIVATRWWWVVLLSWFLRVWTSSFILWSRLPLCWKLLLIRLSRFHNDVVHHIHHNFLCVVLVIILVVLLATFSTIAFPTQTVVGIATLTSFTLLLSTYVLQIVDVVPCGILGWILVLEHFIYVLLCLNLSLRLIIGSKIWLFVWLLILVSKLLLLWLLWSNLIYDNEIIFVDVVVHILLFVILHLHHELQHFTVLLLKILRVLLILLCRARFLFVSTIRIVHIIIGLRNIEILLSIMGVIVDCRVLVIMVLYFNLGCWLVTLSSRIALWAFTLAVLTWLLENANRWTWRSKNSIVCEEIMEVAAQIWNHADKLLIICIFFDIAKIRRLTWSVFILSLLHLFIIFLLFGSMIDFRWDIIIQEIKGEETVLLFDFSLSKINLILIFNFYGFNFFILITVWLLILLDDLFFDIVIKCLCFILFHGTNGYIFFRGATAWTL